MKLISWWVKPPAEQQKNECFHWLKPCSSLWSSFKSSPGDRGTWLFKRAIHVDRANAGNDAKNARDFFLFPQPNTGCILVGFDLVSPSVHDSFSHSIWVWQPNPVLSRCIVGDGPAYLSNSLEMSLFAILGEEWWGRPETQLEEEYQNKSISQSHSVCLARPITWAMTVPAIPCNHSGKRWILQVYATTTSRFVCTQTPTQMCIDFDFYQSCRAHTREQWVNTSWQRRRPLMKAARPNVLQLQSALHLKGPDWLAVNAWLEEMDLKPWKTFNWKWCPVRSEIHRQARSGTRSADATLNFPDIESRDHSSLWGLEWCKVGNVALYFPCWHKLQQTDRISSRQIWMQNVFYFFKEKDVN